MKTLYKNGVPIKVVYVDNEVIMDRYTELNISIPELLQQTNPLIEDPYDSHVVEALLRQCPWSVDVLGKVLDVLDLDVVDVIAPYSPEISTIREHTY